MTAPMKCLMDMDGVLVDMINGMCKRLRVDNPYRNPDNWGIFEMEHACKRNGLSVTAADMWHDLPASFWEELDWTPDGREILKRAEDFFGKENVCLLSSPLRASGAGPSSIIGKMRWIVKHLPEYGRRYLFGSQKQFCANANHVLIDDRDSNVDEFARHGGKVFLVPRLWNRGHADASYVLDSFETYLKGLDVKKTTRLQSLDLGAGRPCDSVAS